MKMKLAFLPLAVLAVGSLAQANSGTFTEFLRSEIRGQSETASRNLQTYVGLADRALKIADDRKLSEAEKEKSLLGIVSMARGEVENQFGGSLSWPADAYLNSQLDDIQTQIESRNLMGARQSVVDAKTSLLNFKRKLAL